jgi:DNA-binding LacI/PurR family transcriptional regulator
LQHGDDVAVGIKDIAAELNLGLSTVAQALQGKGTISPRTRQLVIAHAAKLGYTPNRNAQRMRGRQTGVIGLIVPDVVLSPYVDVVQRLFHLVEGRGTELQIALTEFYPTLEDRAFKSMLASRVDGIIAKVGFERWEDVPMDHYLRRPRAERIPIVLYSNPIEGSGLPYMIHPALPSVRLVVRHLAALGHRRIGAILPAARPFGMAMQNWLGTIRQELAIAGNGTDLQVLGLPADEVGIEGPRGDFRDYINQNHPKSAVPAGRRLFQEAMALPKPPTALVAYSDAVAIGAVFEANDRQMRVGRDIAIAGCGQMPSSFFSPISLTTVDRRPQLYAEKLFNLLLGHMADPARLQQSARGELTMTDEVEPLLVPGESTIGV